MGSAQETPLDERIWRSPELVERYGGIHSNSVLYYFAESPFYDRTSNNATIFTQGMNNAAMTHFLTTRQAFESRLREMQGLEFIVSHDPLLPPYSPYPIGVEPSNIWVIKKQRRRKTRGMPDEVTPLAVYFIVGDVVFMAPKVGDVLANKMMIAVTSLNKFLSTISTLPTFTPSAGYTYLPPAPKRPATTGSTAGSVIQSREGSPVPETQSFNTSLSKTTSPSKTSTSGSFTDANILGDSFRRSARYGNEYMDDNPLTGEPGSFIISKSQQLGHEKKTSQSSNQLKPVPSIAGTKTGTNTNTPTPSPMEIKIDVPTLRKTSQGGQKSPTTPGGSAGGPLKEKPKRRKSKAPGSGVP